MKKRFIALLLCCVMLLTLSPSLISAASATDISGTTQSTEGQVTTGEATDTSGTETSTGLQPDATSGSNPPADPQPDANNGNTSAEVENGGSSEENSGKDPASMTDAELYAHVKQLTTDEAIEAFLKQLPEARVNALIAYAQAQEPTVVPKTVVFTDAGPFMPPVNVAARRMMLRAMAATGVTADNGLVLSKEATANGNGSYTIRMEAYTTGTVTTTTSTVPVDIVLVLDQSGSMADDFNGNSTSNNQNRRQYAMKQAVNSFIGAVNEKYEAEDADHRMAIVTFGDKAKTLQGWTYVDTEGKNTLQGKINGLPNSPEGATNAGAGMQQAEALMDSGYNYTGNNTTRQKVVVFFTDGVPTTESDFDTAVANTAITAAKNMKDSGVTVYSIGIFTGVNPNEMYGASGFDTNSDGTIGSKWIKDAHGLFPGTDFPEADRPAANRFLNLLSSNFQNATGIGLNRKTAGLGIFYYKITYTITSNFDRTASSYYLTADNAASLNNIFQTISQNIQTADISLDSSTVVKDIISPYFTAPADTNDIKVYTAAYQGGNTWGEDTPSSLSPTVNNSSVAVTGFDFNANFITENPKEDGTRGNKLVIEFTVAPKEGFLGGNNVPTNGADSGVYNKEGTVVGLFEQPTVNVPIPDVTVTAQDKNVYLLNDVTAEQLKDGSEISVGDVKLDLSKATDTDKPYGLDPWQTEYVDITVTVKDKAGNVVTDSLSNLTEDTTYTISVTVAPKTPVPTSTEETIAVEKSGEKKANINVFKPEVTFKDSQITLGEKANYADNKPVTNFEVWKHGTTLSNAAGVTMIGTAPELTYTYAPIADAFQQDTPVKVSKVEIGNTVVTSHVTFYREACSIKAVCPNTTVKVENGVDNFIVHVKSLSLEIRKTYDNMLDPNQSAVFEVSGPTVKFDVVIHGTGSVTINGLPIGEYTVTEKNTWTWRYTDTTKQTVTLAKNDTTKTVSFANTNPNPYWLTGGTWCDNRWIDGSKKVPTPASN